MPDRNFGGLLGLNGDNKRIYQIDSSYISQEDYEQGQVIANILWHEDGLINALGATWNMVHDKRFLDIENAFIVDRTGIFGGDSTLNRQYINYNSQFQLNSIADLEQYATILGEGRHFAKIIQEDGLDPKTFKDQDSNIHWKYIRRECPNFFDRSGGPNKEATRLSRLFKADLLGLVYDYAMEPYCLEWIDLETSHLAGLDSEAKVFAEIDFLERALTLRASLRATAIRVIESQSKLFNVDLSKIELTDWESDQLIKKIFETPYTKLYTLPSIITEMVRQFISRPIEERKVEQEVFLSHESNEFIKKLKSGELEHLKPELEIENAPKTEDEILVESIINDSTQREAFLLLVELEKIGDEDNATILREALFGNRISPNTITEIRSKSLAKRVSSSIKHITDNSGDSSIAGFVE